MTIFTLEFTAELVKIISIQLDDYFEIEGQIDFLKVICSCCAKETNISIRPSKLFKACCNNENMEVHSFTECKDCGKVGIIQILSVPDLGSSAPLTAELSKAGKCVTLMHFNMEGFKPNKFSLEAEFVATTEDNRKIIIPFNRGRDFEEEGGTGVAVRNLKLGVSIVDNTSTAG